MSQVIPATEADLTSTWLGQALSQTPAFAGRRVADVHPTRIGEGFGLDGRVYVLTVGWNQAAASGMAGANAPESIVVKLTTAEAGRREIGFYRQTAPHYPGRLPAFHWGAWDEATDRAVLLMEHVAPATQGDALSGASLAQARSVATLMARFHGAFMDGAVGLPASEGWGFSSERLLADLPERRRRFMDRHDGGALPGAVRDLVLRFETELPRAEEVLSAGPTTLTHGDLHLDNVLFLPTGEPVVLDWPGAYAGPPALDFVRLLVEGMTVERRRRHQDELERRYLNERAAVGAPVGDLPRWRREVRASGVWHLAYAVSWAGAKAPGHPHPRVPDIVASLVRNTTAFAADLNPEPAAS